MPAKPSVEQFFLIIGYYSCHNSVIYG